MYPEGLGNRPKPCPHDPFGNDAEIPDSMLFIEVLIAGIIMLGVRFIRKTQVNHETLTFTDNGAPARSAGAPLLVNVSVS